MTVPLSAITNGAASERRMGSYTLTGLKRWSCQSKDIPSIPQIKALHVYDFDNTLFKSPLPNPKLWNSYTASRLQNQDVFSDGGWWHDQRILEATGEGIEKEEPKAWDGWWNEQIAELVQLSVEQDDALTVLLTGRGERNFAHLIKRMTVSKRLEFDMICLKPEVGPRNQRFTSTMQYKQALLQDLIYTYNEADEIKVYEDRPKQTKGLRDFFLSLNQITFSDAYRKPIRADVIQVADQITTLNPVIEAAEVQRMINAHNAKLPSMARPLELKRTVFYTGYLVSPADTAKLLSLVKIPPNLVESEIKYLANSILIVPRPADPNILEKVGGIGYKQTWQVTGFAFFQSNIWAVRVAPIPSVSSVHTINNPPSIVLATYKQTKPEFANKIQTWQPVPADKQYILQTVIGEKVQLRVEAESDEGEHDCVLDRRNLKRRHSPPQGAGTGQRNGYLNDESRRINGGNARNQHRNRGNGGGTGGAGRGGNQVNNRGGRAGIGNGRSGAGGNRGRGGLRGGYKSLDDMGTENARYGASRGEPNYDDYVPGGGGYENTFPAMNAMGLEGPGGVGGLPYGK